MVKFVNVLVQRTIVQGTMEPVVPGILQYEKDSDMESHLADRGKGSTEVHAEVRSDRVEEPDLREFNGEVAKENKACTFPLLLECWYFLL